MLGNRLHDAVLAGFISAYGVAALLAVVSPDSIVWQGRLAASLVVGFFIGRAEYYRQGCR